MMLSFPFESLTPEFVEYSRNELRHWIPKQTALVRVWFPEKGNPHPNDGSLHVSGCCWTDITCVIHGLGYPLAKIATLEKGFYQGYDTELIVPDAERAQRIRDSIDIDWGQS